MRRNSVKKVGLHCWASHSEIAVPSGAQGGWGSTPGPEALQEPTCNFLRHAHGCSGSKASAAFVSKLPSNPFYPGTGLLCTWLSQSQEGLGISPWLQLEGPAIFFPQQERYSRPPCPILIQPISNGWILVCWSYVMRPLTPRKSY